MLWINLAVVLAALDEATIAAAWGHTPSGARWVCRTLSLE
jgi:hypothetical protein